MTIKKLNDTLRFWLAQNNYEDIAKIIDDILLNWKLAGKKTRRNWWEILSGDKFGNPRTIQANEIPVLKAAHTRG